MSQWQKTSWEPSQCPAVLLLTSSNIAHSQQWWTCPHRLSIQRHAYWCPGVWGNSLVTQDSKESTCNAGDLGLIPGLGRSSGEANRIHTPVFLPGESCGQQSLAGYSPWGHKESDPTEPLSVTMPNFKPLWQWETSWEQSQPDFMWSLTLITKVICFS